MAGNEWENFGEEIRKTVQDAVENQDYHKLNQTITETIDRAMGATMNSVAKGMQSMQGSVTKGMPNAQSGRAVRPGYGARTSNPAYRSGNQYRQSQLAPLYRKTGGSKALGIVLGFAGGITGAAFGYSAIVMLISGLLAGMPAEFLVVEAIVLIMAVVCFGVMGYGLALWKREKCFRLIVQWLGNREYFDVKDLASRLGRPEKKLIKDLTKMTVSGWFRQGHFDESKKCFITSDRMYQEYMRLEGQRKAEAARLETKRQEEVERAQSVNSKLSPEARKVIEAGDAYVRKIRACNDAIPGVEISAKISRMEMIVDRIFDRVEQDPDSISDIRKLMDYYLPTTIKLLEAYRDLDAQPVAGENIQNSKREIEATLDTLNVAFEKILDDLFHRTAWDVSSDISVLNTVLAQEGLKDDGMKL